MSLIYYYHIQHRLIGKKQAFNKRVKVFGSSQTEENILALDNFVLHSETRS